MLVLSRKAAERIFIGPDICVTVVMIEENRVRIGIEAPPSVTIWREEIADKIQRFQAHAVPVDGANVAPAVRA